MAEERGIYAFGFGLLGLVYGCAVGVLAIGHGWGSASTSAIGAVFVPAFGVALGSPREHRRSALLMIAAAMILSDLFLVFATQSEGMSYIGKVWSAHAGDVVLWAILWIAWQLAVVGTLVHDIVAARRGKLARQVKNVDGYAIGAPVDV
ncbi:MAG: hypothetical protein P4L85_25305 [Paludisphaera borealis]|uniref:hypothetical protein n=1 Tax=Paludisphaera borealis TaxID=1387353 RepID=UPI00283BD8B3|nr:hypothetical protein [Paludisphaera borealis]MDR3622695.1 hypothetical protein [Paludisphaera borealis]